MRVVFGVAMPVAFLATGCDVPNSNDRSTPTPPPVEFSSPAVFTDSNFPIEVLDSELPVLVEFWSTKCIPCWKMKPAMREMLKEFAGRARIGQFDVDANPIMSKKYEIHELPCTLIFRDGAVVDRLSGLKTKQELFTALADAIAKSPLMSTKVRNSP